MDNIIGQLLFFFRLAMIFIEVRFLYNRLKPGNYPWVSRHTGPFPVFAAAIVGNHVEP